MAHLLLPDFDHLARASGATVAIANETLGMTAHEYAEATSEFWRFTPLKGKNEFGDIKGQMWAVGEWLFSEVALPATLREVEASHVQDAGALISLERHLTGNERGIAEDGNTFVHAPGMIDFWDEHQPFKSFASERVGQDITIPRHLIRLPDGEPISRPDILATSAIGRLVFAEWDQVFADLKRGQKALAQIKLDRLAAVLKIAAGVHPQREDVRIHAREALFRQICRHIEQNLDCPDLSTSALLDQFGVSRATLYRMFEPLGGVRNYLTAGRAEAALMDISRGAAKRGFVNAACDRWGFSSPANFNRTTQRLFGNSPKALLSTVEQSRRGLRSVSELMQTYVSARHSGMDDRMPDTIAA